MPQELQVNKKGLCHNCHIVLLADSDWPSHIYLDIGKPPVKLLSPYFPAKYPSMLDQNVVISSKKDQIIIIEWTAFSIEEEKNCSYDRVIITEEVSIEINYFPTIKIIYNFSIIGRG